MSLIYALLVLGLATGASLLALERLRTWRRRHRASDEHHARQGRLDHLHELVTAGERDAQFDAEVAARLRDFVNALRQESLAGNR